MWLAHEVKTEATEEDVGNGIQPLLQQPPLL